MNKNKGVVYTVKRIYKGTYSVNDLIDSIIKAHYYNDADKEEKIIDTKEQKKAV